MNNLKFSTLSDIAEMNPQDSVDVIGVIHTVGPVGTVTLKNGNAKERRNVLICDDSNVTICICFWGDMARNTNFNVSSVVAVKHAKVSDFAHKSLNANEESHIFIDPDLERSHDLKQWYTSLHSTNDLHALSIGTGLENKD